MISDWCIVESDKRTAGGHSAAVAGIPRARASSRWAESGIKQNCWLSQDCRGGEQVLGLTSRAAQHLVAHPLVVDYE